ncbi:MAG: hypothetical protein ACKVIW_10190, partial [bacterium]
MSFAGAPGCGGGVRPTHETENPILDSEAHPDSPVGVRTWESARARRSRGFDVAVASCWAAVFFVSVFAVSAGPVSASSTDAIRGPWRWIEPHLGELQVAPTSRVGPWREAAITLDSDRRAREIGRLEAALVARDGSLIASRNVGRGSGAPILRKATLESARMLDAAGRSAAAAAAYAAVIESSDAVLVDIWHGLAANLAREGDSLAAERAFLRGLDASGRASDQIRFRYDLAGFYIRDGRLVDGLAVLDALIPHVPESVPLREARAAVVNSLDLQAFMRPSGEYRAWPTMPADAPGWEVFDPRVVAYVERLPPSVQDRLLPVAQRFAEKEQMRLGVYGAAGLLVLLAAVLLLRQRGDVAVIIEYPDELRGIFQVRMRSGRRSTPDPVNEAQIRESGASTRRKHHMVSRETHFQRLFTGRYHLVVDGVLLDPETDEVLGRIREEKIVRVRHRRTVRMEFDAHPSTCPIDLRVVWGDRPAQEAQVTVPGFIDKPRAASGGAIRILLPKGDYRLFVGCGDRVFDHALSVDSFRPSSLGVDVLEAEAVFKG